MWKDSRNLLLTQSCSIWDDFGLSIGKPKEAVSLPSSSPYPRKASYLASRMQNQLFGLV